MIQKKEFVFAKCLSVKKATNYISGVCMRSTVRSLDTPTHLLFSLFLIFYICRTQVKKSKLRNNTWNIQIKIMNKIMWENKKRVLHFIGASSVTLMKALHTIVTILTSFISWSPGMLFS